MSADFFRYRSLVAAAVGAGVLIGAAGLYLYHQLSVERRRGILQREVARLDSSLAELKEELYELKRLAGLSKNAPRNSVLSLRSTADASVAPKSDTDSEVEMYSTIGSDDEFEEFFDLSDGDLSLINTDQAREEDPVLAQMLENVDKLLDGDTKDKKLAYRILLEYYEQHPPSPDLLWRLAKAEHCLATECHKHERKEHILEGLKFAQRAVEMDHENAEAHKWFAILVGSRGQFMDVKARIEDGYMFKEHLDIALALTPEDPTLHHLLGRFQYEVAELTWLERKLAGTLFSEPPTASSSEALESFLAANKLSKEPWKENMLYIAKCYISHSKISEALDWLRRAADVRSQLPEDESVDREILKLLQKHSRSEKEGRTSTDSSDVELL